MRDSDRLSRVLKLINKYIALPRKSSEMIGSVESDPEYQLIVEANMLAVDIDNEICKFITILDCNSVCCLYYNRNIDIFSSGHS